MPTAITLSLAVGCPPPPTSTSAPTDIYRPVVAPEGHVRCCARTPSAMAAPNSQARSPTVRAAVHAPATCASGRPTTRSRCRTRQEYPPKRVVRRAPSGASPVCCILRVLKATSHASPRRHTLARRRHHPRRRPRHLPQPPAPRLAPNVAARRGPHPLPDPPNNHRADEPSSISASCSRLPRAPPSPPSRYRPLSQTSAVPGLHLPSHSRPSRPPCPIAPHVQASFARLPSAIPPPRLTPSTYSTRTVSSKPTYTNDAHSSPARCSLSAAVAQARAATSMALARRLPQDSHVLTVEVSPRGFHFAHAKELAAAMLSHTDINWEFLFTSLWATTLRASWAHALIHYYRVRDTPQGDLAALRDFAADVIPDGSTPEQRLSYYLEQASAIIHSRNENVIGALSELLNSFRAERITREHRSHFGVLRRSSCHPHRRPRRKLGRLGYLCPTRKWPVDALCH